MTTYLDAKALYAVRKAALFAAIDDSRLEMAGDLILDAAEAMTDDAVPKCCACGVELMFWVPRCDDCAADLAHDSAVDDAIDEAAL